MDSFALADQPPVPALGQAPMGKPWVPRDWNGNSSAVHELHRERILAH